MSGKKRMETTFTWNCWTNKKGAAGIHQASAES